MNYIIQLGLNKYEKAILPLENGDEYDSPPEPGKIILFPGGKTL
jgi:hypothetical protein